jgi:hypothetical protein
LFRELTMQPLISIILKNILEKAREFDPLGHAGFDPSGIIRLTP